MFTIFKDFSFAAAHSIRGHTGGCENLHLEDGEHRAGSGVIVSRVPGEVKRRRQAPGEME